MNKLNRLVPAVLGLLAFIGLQAQGTEIIIHKAEVGSIVGHISAIDNDAFNGKENLFPVFTHNYNPGGGPGKTQTENLGMYYAEGMWSIYHESGSDFEVNSNYNVLYPDLNTGSWKHITTDDNSNNNYTVIDHPKLNGDPDAMIFVSHVFNTNGASGSFHQHQIGVSYLTQQDKWAIFNQDLEDMDIDVAFNVVFLAKPEDFNSYVHTVDGDNIDEYTTVLDHPKLNNNPDAKIIITQLWNPGGTAQGKYNDHPVGVYYNGTHWTIYQEDDTYMNPGIAFNVLIINDKDQTNSNHEIMEVPSLRIGPNPVQQGDYFTLGLYNEHSDVVTIEIINLDGRVVKSEVLNNQRVIVHRFSTAGLPQGMYLVSVRSKNLKAIRRIIIN
ncbi:T9SS type A sorting domain-containing protein [bacterium]|nr:T9SS type A sorting domain-containing protein [bacterium]